MPGGYATVSFALPQNAAALRIPASALIFDQGGLRVATVSGDKVAFKPITIARDLGVSASPLATAEPVRRAGVEEVPGVWTRSPAASSCSRGVRPWRRWTG